jgi:hypothetical protein
MMNEEKWMMVKWMKKSVNTNFMLSMSFSLFGMLLIFGLGFVFPTINPYVVIKWIVIVAAVAFLYSFVTFAIMKVMVIKMKMMMKKEGKSAKSKKTSKK